MMLAELIVFNAYVPTTMTTMHRLATLGLRSRTVVTSQEGTRADR